MGAATPEWGNEAPVVVDMGKKAAGKAVGRGNYFTPRAAQRVYLRVGHRLE